MGQQLHYWAIHSHTWLYFCYDLQYYTQRPSATSHFHCWHFTLNSYCNLKWRNNSNVCYIKLWFISRRLFLGFFLLTGLAVLSWTMRCFLRVTCWVKPFPQVIQVKGRSPLWMRSWLHRLTFWVKLLPQVAQLKGLSPLWMRSWACKFPFWEKPFPQKLHLLGRSPVWTK